MRQRIKRIHGKEFLWILGRKIVSIALHIQTNESIVDMDHRIICLKEYDET